MTPHDTETLILERAMSNRFFACWSPRQPRSLLETGFLSLVKLTLLVRENLPVEHDPVWDQIAENADAPGVAARQGASIGMAAHLGIDGTLQPAAYKDLLWSMPMEAHQALMGPQRVCGSP